MAPSKDLCGSCSQNFYGRQSFIRCCGPCSTRYHIKCVNIKEEDLTTLVVNGISIYKCEACLVNKLETPVLQPRPTIKESKVLPQAIATAASEDIVSPNVISSDSSFNRDITPFDIKGELSATLSDLLPSAISECFEKSSLGVKEDLSFLKKSLHNLIACVKNLTSKCTALSVNVSDLKTENAMLRTEMVQLRLKLPSNEKIPTPGSSAIKGKENSVGLPVVNNSISPLAACDDLLTGICPQDTSPDIGQDNLVKNKESPASYSSVVKETSVIPTPSDKQLLADPGDLRAEESDWQMQKRRSRKPATHVKPKALVGTKKSDVRTVNRRPLQRRAFFISRLHPSTSVDQLEDVLRSNFDLTSLKCTRVKAKYSDYSSFHVCVNVNEYERLNNTDCWPEGALVLPFYGKLLPSQVYSTEDETSTA